MFKRLKSIFNKEEVKVTTTNNKPVSVLDKLNLDVGEDSSQVRFIKSVKSGKDFFKRSNQFCIRFDTDSTGGYKQDYIEDAFLEITDHVYSDMVRCFKKAAENVTFTKCDVNASHDKLMKLLKELGDGKYTLGSEFMEELHDIKMLQSYMDDNTLVQTLHLWIDYRVKPVGKHEVQFNIGIRLTTDVEIIDSNDKSVGSFERSLVVG